jgi:hypothetical protein
MGVVFFQGMAHLLMRHPYQTVTHVPGLFCYQSTRYVPGPSRGTHMKLVLSEWMSKSAGEPGLEVTDFLANSIVTEVRHRIAKQPGYAKNFEAFLYHRSGRKWRTQPNGQASKGKSE